MQKKIPRVVIAATQSGSGKTTIVTGLLAAFRAAGLNVQSYKIGPDYIDPGYHAIASGRPGHNLDTWLVGEEKLAAIFARTMDGKMGCAIDGTDEISTKSKKDSPDLAIIEGVMGLYDGGKNGISSTAAVAKLLNAPVLLVINAKSMGESAAALALGFKSYDPAVNIAGVILNRLGSPTHRQMIEEALAKLNIPVYGAVGRNDAMNMPERHLGLLPVTENREDEKVVAEIGRTVGQAVNLAAIRNLAESAPPLDLPAPLPLPAERRVKIAVARDAAFSFYYPASLYELMRHGAEIVEFSPLCGKELPEADGLILGGGFPEMFAKELYANESMRRSVSEKAAAGMPIYAECGGFMYLMREMTDFDGNHFPMTGIVPGSVAMNKKLQTVGYVAATMERDTVLGKKGTVLHGHEFHFSSECAPDELPPDAYPRAFTFQRMRNIPPYLAGYAKGNILGSYLHLHFAGAPDAAKYFVEKCAEYKLGNR